MKRIISLVFMAAVLLQAQIPQVLGVWELDVANSKLPAQLFPAGLKSETRSYVQRNDGYLIALALRVNGNGSLEFIQVAAKSDGKDYPQYQSGPLADFAISGEKTHFTYSETVSGDTAQVIAKRDGQVINKGTRRISTDGKTMTLNVAAVLPDGQEIPIVLIFRKRE